MGENAMVLEEMQKAFDIEEEMGYDAPFVTLTWARWQELQVRTVQGLARFQRAIERGQLTLASFIALEIQELGVELQKEVCAWPRREQENAC